MVSGAVFPKPVVIASHVWKHCTGGVGLDELGLPMSELNSPRNGLMLASEIEAAFDTKRVAFSFDLMADKFTFHVLDSNLLKQPIVNMKDKKTANAIQGYARLDPKSIPVFGALDKTVMTWKPSACPYRRLLAWHYAMSIRHAKQFSWFQPQNPLPASLDSKADLSRRSPDVLWPSSDVLDLFDHAVSKSERDASEQQEQQLANMHLFTCADATPTVTVTATATTPAAPAARGSAPAPPRSTGRPARALGLGQGQGQRGLGLGIPATTTRRNTADEARRRARRSARAHHCERADHTHNCDCESAPPVRATVLPARRSCAGLCVLWGQQRWGLQATTVTEAAR
jgi:hypothetical protein